ncbi:39S ribosomal protein L18, mitochondrial [Nematostella vectensis]|uniref:39S ribosomal protein L18, mitochondrial n=1 Tax=Nematostella vectensis TaxID=45351 RepID=UPI00207759B3|nr:39S ribosomal protein L18, mitochondrial [Nematostella vectensis]
MAAAMAKPSAIVQNFIIKFRELFSATLLRRPRACRSLSYVSTCRLSQLKDKKSSEEIGVSAPAPRTDFRNRNPRDKEYQGLDKPRGYSTQFNRRDYYNKLCLDISNRHIKAYVQHNTGTILASASTTEFPIAKRLYKTTDTSAAANIGRVLSQRCTEAGLTRVYWAPEWADKRKLRVKAFMSTIQKGGIKLTEPKASRLLQDFFSDFKPKSTRKRWKRMPNSEKRKFIK